MCSQLSLVEPTFATYDNNMIVIVIFFSWLAQPNPVPKSPYGLKIVFYHMVVEVFWKVSGGRWVADLNA